MKSPERKHDRHGRRNRAVSRARKRAIPGAIPGTVTAHGAAAEPSIGAIAYGPGQIEETEIRRGQSIEPLLGRQPVTWINVDGLGDADVIKRIGGIFGLHSLALEDVVNLGQRAKMEEYDGHLFIVATMIKTGDGRSLEQLSLFLGEGFVVTFQEQAGDCFDQVRDRIRNSRGQIRARGADYLAYALIDSVVDNYFPVIESYEDRLDELENEIIETHAKDTIFRIHDLKREVRTVRRAMRPMLNLVEDLLGEPSTPIARETQTHLRDCHDHVLRALEQIEAFEEHADDLAALSLAMASHQMNEVMKMLTVVAAVFIPLTFIAGIYGMNFERMPELDWRFGYPAALGVMAAIGAAMMVFFKRKGWF